MNDAVRVARINARAEQTRALTYLVKEAITNPVIEFIGGLALLAVMERYPVKQPLLDGYVKETLATTTLPVLIGAQQLAPFMPGLIAAGSDLVKSSAIAGLLK